MSTYAQLTAKHQKEVDNFPFMFAFGKEQFAKAMAEKGLSPTDYDKIYDIGGGGFILRTDAPAMEEMFARHKAERKEARKADKHLFEMFKYELNNHEYIYTGSSEDTLQALGLTLEEVQADPAMFKAYKKAIASIRADERAREEADENEN